MRATKGRSFAFFFVALSLLVSAPAIASIPRSIALDPPVIDRYAFFDHVEQSTEVLPLHDQLTRAARTSWPIESLPETRVGVAEVFTPLEHPQQSELSRALHHAYAHLNGQTASDQTFAGGDPVNRRDPTGEEYDPAAVHRWFQDKVAVAKSYYADSDSVLVDAAGNTLSDIGSGLSSAFNIGTKTGETYAAEGGFRDAYSTTMILAAGAGDAGETILTAVGTVASGVKTVQTVQQVKSLVRISRELKAATSAEQTGELLAERAMVRRGWKVGEDVKIRGCAGEGCGNQGIDKVFERQNVVSADRTATVEVKSVNRPELRTDRLGIQQGSEEFNRTRLNRAADPRLSSPKTIAAAQRYQKVRSAGRLESYKGAYDASKGSMSFSKLVSDPATAGRTILKEIKTWLLW